MKHKAQAAMEFLTTYGWMIMVTLMVAGAMAYFGLFSQEDSLPQQCELGFDFSCDKYNLAANGTVKVQSTNKLGEPVEVLSFTCIYPDQVAYQEAYAGTAWYPSDKLDLGCYPPVGTGSLRAGERSLVKVRLEYRKTGGGFTSTQEGRVAANVI